MLAAVMDIAWVEHHVPGVERPIREKLLRARLALRSAIDMKRRIIEELRPTLLDNVSLFAALSWHLRKTCHDAGLRCRDEYMDPAPPFNPAASIILFRVAQHSLSLITRHQTVKSASLSISAQSNCIVLCLTHDAVTTLNDATDEHHRHTLALMRNYLGSLGGELQLKISPAGRETLSARIPSLRAIAMAA